MLSYQRPFWTKIGYLRLSWAILGYLGLLKLNFKILVENEKHFVKKFLIKGLEVEEIISFPVLILVPNENITFTFYMTFSNSIPN